MSLRSFAFAFAVLAWLVASAPVRAQEALPPGHPPVSASSGGSDDPHAGAGAGSIPGVFAPPEDTETEAPTLPPGTIEVDLRDADDKPVPRETVTLGILVNSVAKGDSRRHQQRSTDDQGRAVFSNLELVSNTAYRISCGYQGGLFAASPFQMQQARAMRVVLHVYPVVRDVKQALIVAEVTVAAEMREDRVQIEEAMTFYNLGRVAWQPNEVAMRLPEGYTAFSAQASMTDQGANDESGAAVLHGTFPPGKTAIEFRWQLPWSETRDIDFDVGLPPHAAINRVMMPAAPGIKLVVAGFPAADLRHDGQGQTFLVTERSIRPEDPKLTSLAIGIHDLPTPGPGRLVAFLLAACGVAAGLAFAFGYAPKAPPPKAGTRARRTVLLEELAELERARAAGSVGPKTYERSRRELIDALSRVLAHG